jgi:transcriptional regulator with XRE-family HTH domain
MTLKEIVEKLKDRNLTVVADRISIGYVTIRNIASGRNINPTLKILNKISDYLEKN